MMDLNESLRGLYYAPMPLVVLSSVRTIKMLNKPAEKILGIGNMGCSGQKLDRYITASSKAPFTSALNQATEGNTSSDKAIPVSTTSSTLWADLTISTWYRSDPLSKDLSEAINEQYGIGSSTHPQYAARVAHETLYTISIMPSSTLDFPDSRSSENREDTANMLKETFFQCSDIGILAMSRDGKTEIRNQAFDKILSVFSPYQSRAEEIGDNTKEVDGGIMAVIKDTITVYDEDFHAPLEVGEWPIIKCATLGWSVPSVILGVEAKLTGERVTVEVVSKAVRDRGGYGEHVGGVCTVQDITTERRKIKLAAEQQGDAYFRNTIDQIPQLIWVA
jgi:PAS domain-containing protein